MEINLIDPGSYERNGPPYEQFAWLREHDPVFWHTDGGGEGWPGFWAVTRHADITEVSRHAETYSSAEKLVYLQEHTEPEIELQRLMMLNMDPPQHTRQRSFVSRGFTPRMVRTLEKKIRETCDTLIDEVAGRGEADFVTDIAAPLPLHVICELVGAPHADRARLFELTNQMVGLQDSEFSSSAEDGQAAAAEVYAYADALAEQRRQQPADDIVTQLLRPDADGELLSTSEFDLFFLLLIVAGNETTRNAASGGMLAFFEHPQQWQRLLADRPLATSAAEEAVRWVSPVNHFRRTVMADTVLAGQELAEGDKLVVFYPSANRDESVFSDPGSFDIGRDPNPHLGYGGGGPHFCLGRHLAALELRILFETLAERMPGLEQAGEASRLRSNFLNGIKHLPVRFPATASRR